MKRTVDPLTDTETSPGQLTNQRFIVPKGQQIKMLVHRYVVLKVQPKSLNKRAARKQRSHAQFARSELARTALLGSRTENEPSSELVSECPAQTSKGWVVSTNSLVELNDGTSAPTGNLRLTRGAVMASRSEVTP